MIHEKQTLDGVDASALLVFITITSCSNLSRSSFNALDFSLQWHMTHITNNNKCSRTVQSRTNVQVSLDYSTHIKHRTLRCIKSWFKLKYFNTQQNVLFI